jgi:asparagine synthase (glutamine-hydrolysing)
MWVSVDLSRLHQYSAETVRGLAGSSREKILESVRPFGMEVEASESPLAISARDTVTFAWGNPIFTDQAAAHEAGISGSAAAWGLLFERYDLGATAHVRGDYAVAWIEPGFPRVVLCTDRFAVRPLCYEWREPVLRFSDRADHAAGSEATVDPQSMLDYLYFHVIPTPRTAFRNVRRLPPSHRAIIGSKGVEVAPYWRPVFAENGLRDFAGLREEFRTLLKSAVHDQLDARPAGAFLSGGTDSSTVTGMLGIVTGRPARTYSIGFGVEGYDEMEYARVAARHFGTDHHEFYVTPDDVVRSVPDVAAHYDQPFGNSSVLPAYYCARMAKTDGVGKLLAGDGGDELFGGNSRYATQRLFNAYHGVPAWLRHGLIEPLLLAPGGLRDLSVVRKATAYVRQARVPMPDRLQSYNLLTRLGFESVLAPELLAAVDTAEPARAQRDVYDANPGQALINRMLAFDWKYTLADNDLAKVGGAVGMAGVDVGFPLLDERLVDFSLKLPPEYKLKGFRLRWFFKEALRGFLPDAVIAKKKHGFGMPFGVWITSHPALRALAMESLAALKTRRIVRASFLDELVERRLHEHPGYYGEMVWILMMLEQWLSAFDRRRGAPSA